MTTLKKIQVRLLAWFLHASHVLFCRRAHEVMEARGGARYMRCMNCGLRSAGITTLTLKEIHEAHAHIPA